MIPYWPQPVWTAGPFSIHAFGVTQAVALIGGFALALRRAKNSGLDDRRTGWLFITGILVGLAAGAAMNHAIAHTAWGSPGESVVGMMTGVLGVAACAWFRWGRAILPHIDVLASVAPVIGCIARFGCFLAHDHRGRLSSGIFAVRFPEGARIDLGLFECVVVLALVGPIWWLWRSRPKPGVVSAVVVIAAIALRVVVHFLL